VLRDKKLSQIEQSLQPLLTPSSILCTDGNLSYSKIVENVPSIIHKWLRDTLAQAIAAQPTSASIPQEKTLVEMKV